MRGNQITVLQLIHNLKPDGAQQSVYTLVEHLPPEQCRSVVCAFQDGVLREKIEPLGVPVELIAPRRASAFALPWFLADMFRIWRSLARLVEQYEVDVIQTNLLETLNLLVLLLRFSKHPPAILWTYQNSKFGVQRGQVSHLWSYSFKRLAHNLLYRLAAPLVDGFIAVSKDVKQAVVEHVGHVEKKITVIFNAVDAKKYEQPVDVLAVKGQLGFCPADRLIAVVGRLHEQKGHRFLFEAMPAVLARYPDTHLICLGQGDLRKDLLALAEERKISDHVHFLGSRKDVRELVAASEVFVLPSLWEGLSLALLEAMAAARPVVATAVSGTTQAVVSGQTGLLVPPADSAALAEAILRMFDSPQRALDMGRAARQTVIDCFSAEKQAEDHLALYRRVLQQKKPNRNESCPTVLN